MTIDHIYIFIRNLINIHVSVENKYNTIIIILTVLKTRTNLVVNVENGDISVFYGWDLETVKEELGCLVTIYYTEVKY